MMNNTKVLQYVIYIIQDISQSQQLCLKHQVIIIGQESSYQQLPLQQISYQLQLKQFMDLKLNYFQEETEQFYDLEPYLDATVKHLQQYDRQGGNLLTEKFSLSLK
ncbi:hypothetical protein ABPG74_019117 [Tetrahymena malaccensis]